MKILARRSALLMLVAAATAQADETAVRKQYQALFPKAVIESVQRGPVPGLYEVFSDGRIHYVDDDVSHLIQGSIYDVKTRKNLTEERLQKLTALPFNQLPFDLAIKYVKGEGKRQLAVFEDPDCPYCRQLEQAFSKLDNVTIYVFLYPIEDLHPGATEKARQIWCAPDRGKAWLDVMLHRAKVEKVETLTTCDNPVDKLVQLGRRYRITGTPTMILSDDRRMPGAVPAERLETLLNEAALKSRKGQDNVPANPASK